MLGHKRKLIFNGEHLNLTTMPGLIHIDPDCEGPSTLDIPLNWLILIVKMDLTRKFSKMSFELNCLHQAVQAVARHNLTEGLKSRSGWSEVGYCKAREIQYNRQEDISQTYLNCIHCRPTSHHPLFRLTDWRRRCPP